MSEHPTEHTHYHKGQQDASWKAQQPLFDAIHQAGGMAGFVESLGDMRIREAFKPRSLRLGCMDEGTSEGLLVRTAGSLILVSREGALRVIKEMRIATHGRVPSAINSHQNCGAAEIAYGRLPEEERRGGFDAYGKQYAQRLSRDSDVPYGEHTTRLDRPEFHDARLVYVDYTGKLGSPTQAGLPRGFITSPLYVPKEATHDTALCVQIALGDYGMGKRFTNKQGEQLIIVPVVSPDDSSMSLEEATRKLEPIASQYGGRVVIQGFTAPKGVPNPWEEQQAQ